MSENALRLRAPAGPILTALRRRGRIESINVSQCSASDGDLVFGLYDNGQGGGGGGGDTLITGPLTSASGYTSRSQTRITRTRPTSVIPSTSSCSRTRRAPPSPRSWEGRTSVFAHARDGRTGRIAASGASRSFTVRRKGPARSRSSAARRASPRAPSLRRPPKRRYGPEADTPPIAEHPRRLSPAGMVGGEGIEPPTSCV